MPSYQTVKSTQPPLIHLRIRLIPDNAPAPRWPKNAGGRIVAICLAISGQAARYVIVVSNISKRKHAEQKLHNFNQELDHPVFESTAELARQSRHNADIVDAAMAGLFSADQQGRFIDRNDVYSQMLGYRCEELQTLSIPTSSP